MNARMRGESAEKLEFFIFIKTYDAWDTERRKGFGVMMMSEAERFHAIAAGTELSDSSDSSLKQNLSARETWRNHKPRLMLHHMRHQKTETPKESFE